MAQSQSPRYKAKPQTRGTSHIFVVLQDFLQSHLIRAVLLSLFGLEPEGLLADQIVSHEHEWQAWTFDPELLELLEVF